MSGPAGDAARRAIADQAAGTRPASPRAAGRRCRGGTRRADAVEEGGHRLVVAALAAGESGLGGDQLAAKRGGEDGGGDAASLRGAKEPAVLPPPLLEKATDFVLG